MAVLRMVPFAWALRNAGARRGVAVWRVRYRVRGWNGPAPSPVTDVENVLERVRLAYGIDVPVVLVGHSMGGRTALRVAGHPNVRGWRRWRRGCLKASRWSNCGIGGCCWRMGPRIG